MSQLAGKFARHIENGAIVQIVEVGVSSRVATSNGPLPIVQFACECGDTHVFSVDEFFTTFEIVEQTEVRVMEIEAPADAHEFWEEIMAVLESYGTEEGDPDDMAPTEARVH